MEDSGIDGRDIDGKDKEKVIKKVDEVDEDNQRKDKKVEDRWIDGRDKAKSIKGIDKDDEDNRRMDKKAEDRGIDPRDKENVIRKYIKIMRMTSEQAKRQRIEG